MYEHVNGYEWVCVYEHVNWYVCGYVHEHVPRYVGVAMLACCRMLLWAIQSW